MGKLTSGLFCMQTGEQREPHFLLSKFQRPREPEQLICFLLNADNLLSLLDVRSGVAAFQVGFSAGELRILLVKID